MSRQTALTLGICEHRRREAVESYGGKKLAIRCLECTQILAHIGTCDGCGAEDAALHCLVPGRVAGTGKRFCDTTCRDRYKARQRAKGKVK